MRYVDCGPEIRAHLIAADPILGAHIRRLGELKRPCKEGLFPALVSSIISQLISKKAAVTVFGRLRDLAGGTITPAALAAIAPEDIRRCGMTMRKANTLSTIAQMAQRGEVDFDLLPTLSDEEVIRALSALPGVGEWTAQMLLIFALGRPDVISYKDLGIRRGMMRVYGLQTLTKRDFDRLSAAYHPYASAASIYLWHLSDELTDTVGVEQLQG